MPCAYAQPQKSNPKEDNSFARFIPASVKVYARIRKPKTLAATLQRANAWHVLPWLAGNPIEHDDSFNFRSSIARTLAIHNPTIIDEMLNTEVAIVSNSLFELRHAVWMFRLPDEETAERWYPSARRITERTVGSATMFRTRDGSSICIRNDILTIGRPRCDRTILRRIQTLMILAKAPEETLHRSKVYREFASYLPARELAAVFLANIENKDRPAFGWTSMPNASDAMFGLYERDGTLDISIRAALKEPADLTPLKPDTIDYLLKLPQSTLCAVSMTLNIEQIMSAASTMPASSVIQRLMTLIHKLGEGGPTSKKGIGEAGSDALIVWGQDLQSESTSPQLAIMLRCDDARSVQAEFTQAVHNALALVRTVDPVSADAMPAFKLSSHLGTAILHVPLQAYARASKFPRIRIAENLDPAWTSWRNWFIFALSRDHLERILDSQHGLAPNLGDVPNIGEAGRLPIRRRGQVIVQTDLAGDVLQQWIRDAANSRLSVLSPVWWQDASAEIDRFVRRYGIELVSDEATGFATVKNIIPDSLAAGAMKAGDRIVGVDGALLELENPNKNLRDRLSNSTEEGKQHVIRLLRGDAMMQSTLPIAAAEKKVPNFGTLLKQAAGELAALGKSVQAITFTVHDVEENRYSARLTLRFVPK